MNNEQFRAFLRAANTWQGQELLAFTGASKAETTWRRWWKNPSHLLWWLDESGVVSKQQLVLLACGFVRYTPLADGGRTVWDIMYDERSITAVEVCERWANGQDVAKEEIVLAALEAQEAQATLYPLWKIQSAKAANWAAAAGRIAATSSLNDRLSTLVSWAAGAAAKAAGIQAGWEAAKKIVDNAGWQEAARVYARAETKWWKEVEGWQCQYIRDMIPDFIEKFDKEN